MAIENQCGGCGRANECWQGVSIDWLLEEACGEVQMSVEEASVVDVLRGLVAVSKNGSALNGLVQRAFEKLAMLSPGENLGEVEVGNMPPRLIRVEGATKKPALGVFGEPTDDGSEVIAWPKGGGVFATEEYEEVDQRAVACFVIQAAKGVRTGGYDRTIPDGTLWERLGEYFKEPDGRRWTSERVELPADRTVRGLGGNGNGRKKG